MHASVASMQMQAKREGSRCCSLLETNQWRQIDSEVATICPSISSPSRANIEAGLRQTWIDTVMHYNISE